MSLQRPPAARRPSLPPREPPLVRVRFDRASRGGLPFAALALGGALLLLLFTLNGWLLTSDGTGQSYLRQALARVTEIDRLILEQLDELRQSAEEAPDGNVQLPGYPIAVDLPSQWLLDAEPSEIRSRVLEASAERVYREGADAFGDEDTDSEEGGLFSALGAVRRSISLVGDDAHTAWGIAALVFSALAVLFLGLLWQQDRDILRTMRRAGIALVAASAVALLVALAARILARLVADLQSDYLSVQLLSLFADSTTLVLRTSLIFGFAGVALVVIGQYAVARPNDEGGDAARRSGPPQ